MIDDTSFLTETMCKVSITTENFKIKCEHTVCLEQIILHLKLLMFWKDLNMYGPMDFNKGCHNQALELSKQIKFT